MEPQTVADFVNTHLRRAHEVIRAAHRDLLTGLLNRASILESLQTELGRAGREHQPVALLLVDLDRFKLINDTHGHLAGDAVLREAARRMKSAVRRYDSIGRYGGEEFLIVLPGCEGEAACVQANRVREALCSSPFDAQGLPLKVTCSIGVSCRGDASVGESDGLVREADVALYLAKDRGRNRVELFEQALVAA